MYVRTLRGGKAGWEHHQIVASAMGNEGEGISDSCLWNLVQKKNGIEVYRNCQLEVAKS